MPWSWQDDSGLVDLNEFTGMLLSDPSMGTGLTPLDIQKIFSQIDVDGSGTIGRVEFLGFMGESCASFTFRFF